MTKVMSCICLHDSQDKLHGKTNRVHNLAEKGQGGDSGWRCTVCNNVQNSKASDFLAASPL